MHATTTLKDMLDALRTKRKAKARLVGMTVHEASLVDRPANREPFLVIKSADAGLVLNALDKKALLVAVENALEELNGFAMMLGQATTDENAPRNEEAYDTLGRIGVTLVDATSPPTDPTTTTKSFDEDDDDDAGYVDWDLNKPFRAADR